MPKLPVLKAAEAERLLLSCGFFLLRTKGSHRIYQKDDTKIIIPYHSGKSIHPKIVKSVIDAIKQ